MPIKQKTKPLAPARPMEPAVHQWGYERIQSEITPTLKPKTQNWGYAVAALPAAALVYSGAQIIQSNSGAVGPGLLGTGVACAGVTALGLRKKERDAIADRSTEDIAVLTSTYLTRKCFKVLRWKGGWIGYPEKVRVRYAQGAANIPTLKEDLIEKLSNRIGLQYRLVKEDPRRRQFIFQVAPIEEAEEEEAPDVLTERVTKVVTKLFSAQNAEPPNIDLTWDEGKLSKIHVHHDIGYNLTGAMVRKDKAHKLSVMIPGRWKVAWDTEEDTATFTLRPDLPTKIDHPAIPHMVGSPLENYHTPIRYGVDETGEHMAWRPWLDPMMLIVGRTGRGKTVVAHSILTELAARGWMIDVSDAKLIEFIGYKDWPNVRCVGAILEEQVRLVHAALELMQDRYAQIVNGEAKEEDFQPYCLFLDEYALFREDLADWYSEIKRSGEPAKVPTPRKVNAVLRAGRTARVHFVLLTQRPDAEVLGSGEPRLNLSCRVSMGPLDMDGARMMWSSPSAGVAVATNIRGRGTTRNEAGEIVDFQAYWTPDPRKATSEEDWKILDGLRPAKEIHEKLKIILPKASVYDEKSQEVLPPSYSEYAAAKMVPVDYSPPEEDEETDDPLGQENADEDAETTAAETAGPAPKDELEDEEAGGIDIERSILRLVRTGADEPDDEATPARPARAERPQRSSGSERPQHGTARGERAAVASVTELRIRQRLEEEAAEVDEEGTDEGFGEIRTMSIETIEPGAKVLLDEAEGTWAIVSDSMPDEAEEDHWVLSCVTDDGMDEAMVAPHGELFSVRLPA
ncbi:hypothetical protein [Arthrobacter cryoconiti]|uniref:FtsK domain-containing protein n=1 Tax=Arthrobacter cryoconiti TaxID=748907 RepID=A0ABV8R4F0_9MICC|nr:hypothetical protein [Arthrobacter cryoconiti]MCC9069336.1 hypothetical protein [Arthrobacter cryoconiti]